MQFDMIWDLGMTPFGIFEIAPVGIVVAAAGAAFLAISAPRILPVRQTVGSSLSDRDQRRWLVDMFIPAGSPLIGTPPSRIAVSRTGGSRVVDLVRKDVSYRKTLDETALLAGDSVVLATRIALHQWVAGEDLCFLLKATDKADACPLGRRIAA